MLLDYVIPSISARMLGLCAFSALVTLAVGSWFKPSLLPNHIHATLSRLIHVSPFILFEPVLLSYSIEREPRSYFAGDIPSMIRLAPVRCQHVRIHGQMARAMLANFLTA